MSRFNLTDGVCHGPPEDTTMTKGQKIIRAKAGLLELARQLGNVPQACKMMGYGSVPRMGI